MFKKTAVVFCIVVVSIASFAYNHYKCKEVADTLYGYGWLYRVVGAITQTNECALVEGLKIETGEYYHAYQKEIDSDVAKGHGPSLDKFGKFIGCEDESLMKFAKTIVENQDFIFSRGENIPRKVMLNIYKKIDEDPKLRELCHR